MPIDKIATADWYNTAAPIYDFFRNLTRKVDRDVLPYAIDRLGANSSDLVLDAGTGPGTYAIEVALRSSARVMAIDIAPRFVKLAMKNAATQGALIQARQGDMESLPFEDGTFDKIICGGALQAVAGRERAASELQRVLRPDGRIMIVEPDKNRSVNDRLFLILMYLTGLPIRKLHAIGADQLTDYFFEETTLVHLLEGARLSIVEMALRSGTMCVLCEKRLRRQYRERMK